MTERVMPDEVFASLAAVLELDLERYERSIDDEKRRQAARDADEEARDGHRDP